MKISYFSRPFMDRIRQAVDSEVIDGWGQHGPYLVFTNGTARFYVRRHEAEDFMDRLLHLPAPAEQAVA